MKKLLCLSCMILLLSGCSIVYVDKQPIDEIVDSVITKKTNLKSVSLEGYSYYLPQGVHLSRNDRENSILYYNHKKMYLYVDLISYYHKVSRDYIKNTSAYYSLPIDKNGKHGYIEITQISTNYFIEFMYHYSKMEAYVSKEDINKTITQMAYILNSVKFNDSVIESLIGENLLNYSEEQFNIFKPNGKQSDYLDYIEQYDDGRSNSKDEDTLKLEGSIE